MPSESTKRPVSGVLRPGFLRALAVLLPFALPLCARAQTSGYLTYSDSGTAVTITGHTSGATGAITIPSTINGHPVTTISDYALAAISGLTGITMPSSVTTLGSGVFVNCTNLTSVTLSPSLTTIPYETFDNCSSLSTITIPASVTSIGDYAFQSCSSLASIIFLGDAPSAIPAAFQGVASNASITYTAGTNGWTNPFAGLPAAPSPIVYTTSGGNVTITGYTGSGGAVAIPKMISGNPVTAIAASAFAGATLTSITIPASVTSIGASAFAGCTSLTSVTFWGNAPSTSSTAFQGDSGATITYYPGTTGWTNPFAGLTATASPFSFTDSGGAVTITGYSGPGGAVTIPATLAGDPVTAIAANAFASSALTSVTIPAGVNTIGARAFASITGLRGVTFLGNAPTTDSTAFQGDSSASITYNPGTTGWTTPFAGLPAAANVFVYSISGGAVTITGYNGSGGAVTIPGTLAGYPVTAIAGNAFGSATSTLTSVVIPSGVTTIGDSAFYGCTILASVTIPATVTSIGSSAFDGCSALTSAALPSGITTIGSYAFYGCSGLTSLALSYGLTSIGDEAFYGCSGLTGVSIPTSVTAIGTAEFYGCTSLSSVTIPGSVTSIGAQAFQNCTSLAALTIPGSVTAIGSNAFAGCVNLTAITCLGNAPTTDPAAFQGDTRARITYFSGKTGWTNPFAGVPTVATAAPSVSLSNLSARAFVNTGANILIAGFGTTGSGTKNLLLRGVGPGLYNTFQLAGYLPSVQLALYDNGNPAKLIASNTGWTNNPVPGNSPVQATISSATTTEMNTVGAFAYAAGSLDAALFVTVPNTSFTYQIIGQGANPTGIALAEIYDADGGTPTARLINISARAQVGTGGGVLIGGFSIAGNATERLLIRGVGPGLFNTFQLAGTLPTPLLQLYDSENPAKLIASNSGWNTAPATGPSPVVAIVQPATTQDMNTVGAFGLTQGSADAAMEVSLPAGQYTAELSGVGSSTGIGLVEVYELP